MFTKSDFIKYFNQIGDLEQKMVANMDELLGILDDASAIAILTEIRNDEIRHVHILNDIEKIFSTKGR
jgi:hypothetical protein